jgi:hypothetical protein
MSTDEDVSTESLVALVLGCLGEPEAQRLGARVAASNRLSGLVREIRDVVATLEEARSAPPAPDLIQRAVALYHARRERPAALVRRVLARLIFDSRLEATPAGLRGDPGPCRLCYSSEAGAVDLELAPPPPPASAWRVVGQLSSASQRGAAEVSLVRRGGAAEVASATADERGRFRLQADPGEYELRLRLGSRAQIVAHLEIR